MPPEELQKLQKEVRDLTELVEDLQGEIFKNNFSNVNIITKELRMKDGQKITFHGENQIFEIYREIGDSGELRIDSAVDLVGKIKIGGLKKPNLVYIYGSDEGLLGANNNTNDSYILIEPGRVGIFTNKGNDFFFRLPNGSADPSVTHTGAMAVVNGVLKIYNGSAWVNVGSQ